ncbi:hypothetical protein EV182_005667, partial [Spiromyces aspiralis]
QPRARPVQLAPTWAPVERHVNPNGGTDLIKVTKAPRYQQFPFPNEYGGVDILALSMSLQSGLPMEVVNALNTLVTITAVPILTVPIKDCGELLEILAELLNEAVTSNTDRAAQTAFEAFIDLPEDSPIKLSVSSPPTNEPKAIIDRSNSDAPVARSGDGSPKAAGRGVTAGDGSIVRPNVGYSDVRRLAHRAFEMYPGYVESCESRICESVIDAASAIPRWSLDSDWMLVLVYILRNLSFDAQNAQHMAGSAELLQALESAIDATLDVCEHGMDSMSTHQADRMLEIQKSILLIVSHLSQHINLRASGKGFLLGVVRLLLFFLDKASIDELTAQWSELALRAQAHQTQQLRMETPSGESLDGDVSGYYPSLAFEILGLLTLSDLNQNVFATLVPAHLIRDLAYSCVDIVTNHDAAFISSASTGLPTWSRSQMRLMWLQQVLIALYNLAAMITPTSLIGSALDLSSLVPEAAKFLAAKHTAGPTAGVPSPAGHSHR